MVRRVLIIRNDEIGDFVMSSALIREIRRMLPKSYIALVVNGAAASLAERCPYIDKVHIFVAPRGIPGFRRIFRTWYAYRFAGEELAAGDFDLAIVPRWDVDSYGASEMAYFSRARWRVGFSEEVNAAKSVFNHGYNSFFTHVLDGAGVCHEVQRSSAMVRYLGINAAASQLECWTNDADEAFASAQIGHLAKEGRLLVALSPGAGAPARRWPVAAFLALAQRLQSEGSAAIVLIGSPEERQLGETIASGLAGETIDLIGRTTLPQAAAVLRRCHAFAGNDSGPMHLAAAARIPVVEISCHPLDGDAGSSHSPERFGPWQVSSEVLRPRHRQLPKGEKWYNSVAPPVISDITVDQVVAAVYRVLKSRPEVAASGSERHAMY